MAPATRDGKLPIVNAVLPSVQHGRVDPQSAQQRQRLLWHWHLASMVKLLLVALGWWASRSERLALLGVAVGFLVAL